MKTLIGAAAALGLAIGGLSVGAMTAAPAANAAPCMTPGGGMGSGFGGGAWGSGGGRCDGAPAPDGSFERCENVSVLGFGGWNCYRVYP